jgi:hypothetical protein
VFEIAGLDRADARTGLQEDLDELLGDVVKTTPNQQPGLRTQETT